MLKILNGQNQIAQHLNLASSYHAFYKDETLNTVFQSRTSQNWN